jgi:hypothetical protein
LEAGVLYVTQYVEAAFWAADQASITRTTAAVA